MKKKYEKPVIFAESFALVEHISALCNVEFGKPNIRDATSCSYTVDGENLFYGGLVTDCNSLYSLPYVAGIPVQETPMVICYNTGFANAESNSFAGS